MSYRIDGTCQRAGKHGSTSLLPPWLGAQDQVHLPLLQQSRLSRANHSDEAIRTAFGDTYMYVHIFVAVISPPVHCGHDSL